MNYTVENVVTKEQLDNLYNNSAFTIEGLSKESISDLVNWLKENTTFENDNPTIFVISGGFMNDSYGLHGDNAYPNDLTIVSVADVDLLKLVTKRFEVGGRWFDDVVDNNLRREAESY